MTFLGTSPFTFSLKESLRVCRLALKKCFTGPHIDAFMKRGEKPEGYRQMRPKTFPASNYPGSSRQMLQEIRESLRNLSKPSDAAKAEHNLSKMSIEDPRQVRNPPKFGTHHKALQEIRNSLLPFANETSSSRSPSEVNPQMFQDLQAAGFDEVRMFKDKNKPTMILLIL